MAYLGRRCDFWKSSGKFFLPLFYHYFTTSVKWSETHFGNFWKYLLNPYQLFSVTLFLSKIPYVCRTDHRRPCDRNFRFIQRGVPFRSARHIGTLVYGESVRTRCIRILLVPMCAPKCVTWGKWLCGDRNVWIWAGQSKSLMLRKFDIDDGDWYANRKMPFVAGKSGKIGMLQIACPHIIICVFIIIGRFRCSYNNILCSFWL